MTGAGPSLLQAAPRSDGRTGAHCSAARVRTQYHESLQNVSSVMRSGAKLIHKSSNNSGALPRIENYVGLRIESNELFAARQALLKSDGRFPVSHCCDLALLFDPYPIQRYMSGLEHPASIPRFGRPAGLFGIAGTASAVHFLGGRHHKSTRNDPRIRMYR